VLRLNAELARIVAMEDVRAQLANMGMEPLSGSPEEFAADIKADRQHWATVIRDAGLPSR
jgi:tripartite-type tricarboxylate transporter receptor subunit TctC